MNTMSFNILTKITNQKEGGGGKQMLTGLTKGGGRVGEMLTVADKCGRGGGKLLTKADEGGRGVWTPPFLADIICEQPLTGRAISNRLAVAAP